MTTNLQDVEATVDLFDRAASALIGSPHRRHAIEQLPPRGRLLATGDLHDNPIHLAKIVRLAGLDGSPDHHVVLQELIHGDKLINGMDFSYRMLGRVAELVLAHPGQVHPTLANHELAQLTGRGVSKGAGNSVELFNDALEYVFQEDSPRVARSLNRFIAAMPIALRSESGILCAHSLPSPQFMAHFDLRVLERDLNAGDYRSPTGSVYLLVWGRNYTEESVAALASAWGVKLFCVGHEHVDTGIELRSGRVIVLNSDHDRATVVALDLAGPASPEEILMSATPLAAVPG